MTANRRIALIGVLILSLGLIATGGWAGQPGDGPPRYPVNIDSEAELLRVMSAGLVGDAFGYDANEVLYQIRATGMPIDDIVPTFYLAYLSGRSFAEVIAERAKGEKWGQIAYKFSVTSDMLNEMAIPQAVNFTDTRQVPDDVMQDMFVASALAYVFEIDPEETFQYYQDGWYSVDVLAAAHLAYQTKRPVGSFLAGEPREIDWYRETTRTGLSLARIAQDSGRVFDNMVPLMAEDARKSDLETMYAIDMAAESYDVPIETVRRVRYRYLYSPSELMVSFYVSHFGPYDYWNVGRLYCHSHWRNWGPTIVALGIPSSYFSGWSIWHGGPVSFYSVDAIALHHSLLSHSLVYRTSISIDFYDRFDPWFGPRDAILYCGVYRHHRVAFDDYYSWHHGGHNWRDYQYHGRDYTNYRRDLDWVGNRRVGAIVGSKRPVSGPGFAHQPDYRSRTAGSPSPSYRHEAPRPSSGQVGIITGRKSYDERTDRRYDAPRQPQPDRQPQANHQTRPDQGPERTVEQPSRSRSTISRYGTILGSKSGSSNSDRNRNMSGVEVNQPRSGSTGGPRNSAPKASEPKVETPQRKSVSRYGVTLHTNTPAQPEPKRTTYSPGPSSSAPRPSRYQSGSVSGISSNPQPSVSAPSKPDNSRFSRSTYSSPQPSASTPSRSSTNRFEGISRTAPSSRTVAPSRPERASRFGTISGSKSPSSRSTGVTIERTEPSSGPSVSSSTRSPSSTSRFGAILGRKRR